MTHSETSTTVWFARAAQLSPQEQTLLQLLAVHYEPVRRKALLTMLRDAAGSAPDGERLTQLRLTRMLDKLVEGGFALRIDGGIACPDFAAEELMRQLTEEGHLEHYAALVRQVSPIWSESWRASRFRTYLQGVRELRIALYQNDLSAMDQDLTHLQIQYVDRVRLEHPYARILQHVYHVGWLLERPLSFVLEGFHRGLSHTLMHLTPGTQLLPLLQEYCEAKGHECPEALRLLLAQHQLFQGAFSAMQESLDGIHDYRATGLLACHALIQRRPHQAHELFAQALAEHADGARKVPVAFHNFLDLFYLLHWIQRGDPESLQCALTILQRARRDAPSHLREGYRVLEKLIHFQSGDITDTFLAVQEVLEQTPWSSLTVWLQAWASAWIDPKAAPTHRATFRQMHDRARACGYRWLQAEMAEVLEAMDDHDNARKALAAAFWRDTQTQSFFTLLEAKEPWERCLDALIHFHPALDPSPESDEDVSNERLAWLVQTAGSKVMLEPRHQKRNAKGKWSKGRKLSLQRLHEEAQDLPFLSEQDIAISQHIYRKTRGHYGYGQASYDWDNDSALLALVGHPHVFWYNDKKRTPVEVERGEPELRVTQEKDAIRLELAPSFPKDTRVTLVQESPTRLRVVEVREKHRRLQAILGTQGLEVPSSAQNAVMQAIGAVAPLVTIHSDIGGGTEDIEELHASDRIVAQLTPFGPGLRVELRVQPFHGKGPLFRPGAGGSSVFARIERRQFHTRRDLAQEKRNAERLLAACPTLEALSDDAGEWRIEDPESCLELLTELKALVPHVELRWPEGEAFAIRQQASTEQLKLKLHGESGWFEATGDLDVDNELVLKLSTLLELSRHRIGRFVRLQDGQYLALTQSLRRRLDDLHAYADTDVDGDTIKFHASAALALEALWEDAGSVQADRVWKSLRHRINQTDLDVPDTPSTLQAELRDYQHEGYRWLRRLASLGFGACLADEMGLGKTLQALALILHRATEGPALVIAPTSVCLNWIEEARRFAPTLQPHLFGGKQRQEMLDQLGPFDLLICSYGLLQNEIDRLAPVRWTTIVLDEAQAIKNAATKRSQAAMRLQGNFKLITTGTPIENHLGELWNLFRFLNPGLLGSWERFQETFVQPIERDSDRDTRHRLRRLIKPYVLRRRKQDVLDELPPRTDIVLRVEMTPDERAMYEALRQSALQHLAELDHAPGSNHVKILAELTRLRQACCHPQLVLPHSDLPSSKLQVFEEVLEELLANRHKILVFSQFVSYLEFLREILDERRIAYQYLDGSTPQRERQQSIQAFQAGEGDVFLLSLKAGGFGINLTAADYVIHMDPWWNPAVEDQASDRAHRIGQQRPVTVYRLVTQGTVEEKIVELHHRKRDLANSLLEGSNLTGKMTSDELLALIQEPMPPSPHNNGSG